MKKSMLITLITTTFLLLMLIFISIAMGSFSLTLEEIANIFLGNLNNTVEYRVFYTLRLPRTFMAIVTGVALGISGGVYQTIFRNPLASPDITGVASSASLGAGFAIVSQVSSPILVILLSFAGGMLSIIALIFLTYLTGVRKLSNFLFAGIIIKCLADAGLMILKTLADPQSQLAAIEYWIMGTLANVTDSKLLLPLIGITASAIILLISHRQITMLNLGDDNAKSSGLNPTFWRFFLLIITTFMVSCAVSVVGSVAFVGLIAPHIALMITKKRGFLFLLMSMMTGAIITVFADIIARTFSAGAELPLSIPIVIISVPILIFLVFKARRDIA